MNEELVKLYIEWLMGREPDTWFKIYKINDFGIKEGSLEFRKAKEITNSLLFKALNE